MANPSSIIENDVVNLELTATLVDEEHIGEFEAILHDSLEEIHGNLCAQNAKRSTRPKGDEGVTSLTSTLLKICCRKMI